jgi:hypothetical protein
VIAGDSGDSILNLWIMRSVQAGLPHGWNALWSPPVFHPASNTLAYSDTLLPVALVHWPLRLLFGDTLAFNFISLGAWVLCSWCTYRIARRVVTHWPAAFVAALAFTYSTIRIIHHGHFQLVVGGALATLVVLLLVRVLEAPSVGRGLALGGAFAALTLTASYYGAMTGVVVLVVAAGWLFLQPRAQLRTALVALACAAAVVVVFVVPVGVKYVQLQRDPDFRRGFEPSSAAHPGDFLSVPPGNYLLADLPGFDSHSASSSRGVESRLFPGLLALGFGAVGFVLAVGESRRRGVRTGRTRLLLLVGIAGVVCLVLAIGDWIYLGDQRIYMPFKAFREFVPGFAGIRAVSRFSLVAELALALFAAVGIDALLARLRSGWSVVCVAALVAVVCLEAGAALSFVRVPAAAATPPSSAALKARPAGVVVELPMGSQSSGAVWPYTESPRQYAALRDGRTRVNGYSGFQPPDFDKTQAALNGFPSPDALGLLRLLGVRYVVLRTALVGELTPPVEDVPSVAREGIFSDAEARAILQDLPARLAGNVTTVPGGYVIDLGT